MIRNFSIKVNCKWYFVTNPNSDSFRIFICKNIFIFSIVQPPISRFVLIRFCSGIIRSKIMFIWAKVFSTSTDEKVRTSMMKYKCIIKNDEDKK